MNEYYAASRKTRLIPRRSFLDCMLVALPLTPCFGQLPAPSASATTADRKLAMRIKIDGFGSAKEADIKAVLLSTASEIWQHCSNTRFEQPGFDIYHNSKYPITHFTPSQDGWLVIGLAVEGNLWARFAYQFAHEFAHALMDHSNDSRKLWHKLEHANQWLEECLCEMASLFCLRAMAQSWQTKPPYPNWKSYAPALADYSAKLLANPQHQLPEGQAFASWFAAEESGLHKNWAMRDKNTVIARQLLPLFEASPRGWEALPSLKLGTRDFNKPLAKHLAEWHPNAPVQQRLFITSMADLFGIKV
jgi:hypothetical protein